MNIKQAAQEIRDSVTMEQIIALYGYTTKGGFMRCPFHGEKTASLKVYKGTGGWHCFGCDHGGSVIDFVMEHEHCGFSTAVRAIDNALHLNLMDPEENPMQAHQADRLQIFLDDFVTAVNEYCDAVSKQIQLQQMNSYKELKRLEEIQYGHAEDLTAEDYTFLLTWDEEDQYADYQIRKIEEFKEEVAAWRRKARNLK